jgi:hypothetical protein
MSFDQFNQDQVVNLDYSDNNGRKLMGFSINDRAPVDIYDMVAERNTIMAMPDTVSTHSARRVSSFWTRRARSLPPCRANDLNRPRVIAGRRGLRPRLVSLT